MPMCLFFQIRVAVGSQKTYAEDQDKGPDFYHHHSYLFNLHESPKLKSIIASIQHWVLQDTMW